MKILIGLIFIIIVAIGATGCSSKKVSESVREEYMDELNNEKDKEKDSDDKLNKNDSENDDFNPKYNEMEDVYGPPSFFEDESDEDLDENNEDNENKDDNENNEESDSDKDFINKLEDFDPQDNEIKCVYGPPEYFENVSPEDQSEETE